MADTLKLQIVTPEKIVVKDDAEELQIPGKTGYLGILPGHAPLITELGVGEMTYKKTGGAIQRLAVSWGFAEVLPDRVTILAESAEKAADINVSRAESARRDAEQHLDEVKGTGTEEEYKAAEDAVKRAETQIEVAQGK